MTLEAPAAGEGLLDVPVGAAEWERLAGTGPLPWAMRVPPPAESFRGTWRWRWIDDVGLVDWTADPVGGARGPQQLAATEQDYLVVLLVRSGRGSFRNDDQTWRLAPGSALVWESRRPARFAMEELSSTRSVVVPRPVLEEIGCRLYPGQVGAERGPSTDLLTKYLDALDVAVDDLSPTATVAARNAVLELVWGAFSPATPLAPQAIGPARRAAVERYLDTRLGQPALSAPTVAAAHNLSVRTLERLFAGSGETFGQVLWAKRLARVRDELLEGDVPVAALARRWGFVDASHLGRRFRTVYGVSPREYRAGRGSPAGSGR